MPTIEKLQIKDLILDLSNYRTPPQKNEEEFIRAVIAIKPDTFFALIESIVDSGYFYTENLLVIKKNKEYIVKEGNRRASALKIIHGYVNSSVFDIPRSIDEKIKKMDESRKESLKSVFCAVHEESEINDLENSIALLHGKGEKAARDPWNSIAKARHNKIYNGKKELALDLLEKYLLNGENLSKQQKRRWQGDYHLSVLTEALQILEKENRILSADLLVEKYPKIDHRGYIEDLMYQIGMETVGFRDVRASGYFDHLGEIDKSDLLYNKDSNSTKKEEKESRVKEAKEKIENKKETPRALSKAISNVPPIASDRYIKNMLKKFSPAVSGREKVVYLRDELLHLNVEKNPFCFCVLLRSMLEISCKEFLEEKNIRCRKRNGNYETLSFMVASAHNEIVKGDSFLEKKYHGVKAELLKQNGMFSIDSMNQMIHNGSFTMSPQDVRVLFSNVYLFLEAIN